MIIEPEVQVSINVHTTTKIEYLNAKSYWITDTGRKVRKFSKSIGKLDDFRGGRGSAQVKEVANLTMQEIMYQHYKDTYK